MLKTKKRITKTKLKEDRFVLFTAQAETWIENHRKELLYGISGVILVVLLGVGFNWSRSNAEKNAAFEELLARDAFSRAALDSAVIRADVILDDYSGTSSAAVAQMIKGRVHEARGELEEAAACFEKVINDHSGEEYLAFGAYYALGNIALGQNDPDKAASYFEKGSSKYPNHFSAPVALVSAGKAFEKAGKFNQAKTAYRKVLSKYSKSRSADNARDNLAKLEFKP